MGGDFPGSPKPMTNIRPYDKGIVTWLLAGCLLIFSMVIIGGITRLTGSGLSITEWNVLMGALPPVTQENWQELYEKYRQSPQFQKVNYDMDMGAFKSIFWWEYLHRLTGRLTGIVFIVPFFYFLLRKRLDKALIRKSVFVFLLGGLQGFIGWYMVKSGLVDNPRVSHYRLALHLFTAFLTYSFILWFALDEIYPRTGTGKPKLPAGMRVFAATLLPLALLQIVYGAFVAGLHAGKIYNTFPKMGEDWIPSAVTAMSSFGSNITENLAGVQFVHRILAGGLSCLLIAFWWLTRKYNLSGREKISVNISVITLIVQYTLGVITLLYAVPVVMGVLHQAGAFVLLTALVFMNHRLNKG